MKGLDTSVLLALLHGDSGARAEIHRLREVELATTEANLLELALLAARAGSQSRRRRGTLEQIRHRLTVIPIDSRATERVALHLKKRPAWVPLPVLGMLGALESAGCDELLTRDDPRGWGEWSFKIRRITGKGAK